MTDKSICNRRLGYTGRLCVQPDGHPWPTLCSGLERDLELTLEEPTIERGADGITVRVMWSDGNQAHAWGLGPRHGSLAARLVTAIRAGVVLVDGGPFADGPYAHNEDGTRRRHCTSLILGRTMNADLHRLGY